MGGETDCDLAIRESSSSSLATTHSKPSLFPSLSITVHAGHWRVARVVLASLSYCSFVLSSLCPLYLLFIAAIRPPSPPSKEIHRIGTGPLTAVRSRSAATSFATDVGSGRGWRKHAKGLGASRGRFSWSPLSCCHRNFHLSKEKQSPTSPPNFLRSEEGGSGCIRFIQEWQEIATRRQ